ncbi:SUMF1/EgtB/PvdO family nonheme iron enzyme [Chloroflexota bacterium]
MTIDYNLSNIRSLLTEGFNAEELRSFCFDRPDFRPVYEQLAEDTGKAQIIHRLIEYAERKELFAPLLIWAEEQNPAKYKGHQPYHSTLENGRIIDYSKHQIRGTLFDEAGFGVEKTLVKLVIDEQTHKGITNEDGTFSIDLHQEVDEIMLYAMNDDRNSSIVKVISWDDAITGVNLNLQPVWELTGIVRWCGTREPISEAQIRVHILGDEVRNILSDTEGKFTLQLPKLQLPLQQPGSYNIEIEASGAVASSFRVEQPIQKMDFFLARSCTEVIHETIIVERICDDLGIDFVHVPDGTFKMGPPDRVSEASTEDFYVSRYPITCIQYSFYLQHNPDIRLPTRWGNRLPPPGKTDHPVTRISWDEAQNFCAWLSDKTGAICRLPTEMEWQKTARGQDDARRFPWGDNEEQLETACNSANSIINQTTPVNQYPRGRSPFGAWDMVGNVWEWTATPEDVDSSNSRYIACGGSYRDRRDEVTCFSHQVFSSKSCQNYLGFRILRERGGKNAIINK